MIKKIRRSNFTIQDEDMMARMLFQVVGAFATGFSGITINDAALFNFGRKLEIV